MDSRVAIEKKDEIPMQDTGSKRSIIVKMTSTDAQQIKKTSREFYEYASAYDASMEKGKSLKREEASFTIRKSPCGNGTATFSRIKLRVERVVFKLKIKDNDLSDIISFLQGSPVDTEVEFSSLE